MSADAKVWQEESNGAWRAVHDGDCTRDHHEISYGLSALLREIEDCMNNGKGMRWEIRAYPNDQFGLSGYCV